MYPSKEPENLEEERLAMSMGRMTRCAPRLLAVVLLALGAVSCEDDGSALDPPSATRIMEVCETWADVACRKNLECGVGDSALDACREAELGECMNGVESEAESCQARRVDAIESCSESFEAETCSDYCSSSGFCFHPCFYICPAG